MVKPFEELRQKMPLEARKKADEIAKRMLRRMALRDLRQTQQVSQEKLAKKLSLKQANISRLENQTDMYVSTLENYIQAIGGKLDMVAKFPEGDIHLHFYSRKRQAKK